MSRTRRPGRDSRRGNRPAVAPAVERADPLRPSRWRLAAAALLVAAWIVALVILVAWS